MKHIPLKWLAAMSIVCLMQSGHAAEPVAVVASFSILGDLVQVVGGDRVKVITLVGGDADAHTFEPKPTDAQILLKARLLVINGLNFEPWAQKLVRSAAFQGDILVASQGISDRGLPSEKNHAHANIDPHAWQDPRNVIVYVKNIAKSLSNADPAGIDSYQNNSDAYIRELEMLDQFAQEQFAKLRQNQRLVITSHDAFGYFAARYAIRFLAPQGLSTETEPSAKAVAQLIRQIQRNKIRAVFLENMSNPKLLAQISHDCGIAPGQKLYVDALSGPFGPASTYLKMMYHNVTQLAAGMRLQ